MRDEAPTSTRETARARAGVALDQLVTSIIDLPYADGDEAVAQALVDALGEILPGHAVGACLVGDAVPQVEGARGTRARQQVLQHVPEGAAGRTAGIDPTRLFPGWACERVFDLGAAAPGSTLHVAGDDPSLEDDGAAVLVARRTASAFGPALAHARTYGVAHRAVRDLRALESQVIQADKLASFGQIAAGLVHELNNPLTSIVAYTDYLIRKALARAEAVDPEDMERLRRISESANRMLRFTRDLVTYARPSGEAPTAVVLHGVIDQALAFCEHVLAEAGATVKRRYGDDVLTVRGMPQQLTQVFVNLVTNACHALGRDGGTITITTTVARDDEPRVRIRVHDDGHGIAEEHLSHVFVPFFTTKREGRGTGLGLSIVKNIVQGHGGSIRVDSAAADGTTFTIELPLGR